MYQDLGSGLVIIKHELKAVFLLLEWEISFWPEANGVLIKAECVSDFCQRLGTLTNCMYVLNWL